MGIREIINIIQIRNECENNPTLLFIYYIGMYIIFINLTILCNIYSDMLFV